MRSRAPAPPSSSSQPSAVVLGRLTSQLDVSDDDSDVANDADDAAAAVVDMVRSSLFAQLPFDVPPPPPPLIADAPTPRRPTSTSPPASSSSSSSSSLSTAASSPSQPYDDHFRSAT